MKNQILHSDHGKKIFTVIILILTLSIPAQLFAQLAAGKSKFLGNVTGSSVPSNFSTYWNQITPENSGKWGSVEPTRDVMNFGQEQTAYNYAKSHGYKFKHHNLIWGAQAPGWITSLSQADQKAEIIEWFQAVASTFPNLDFIDVVNEPIKTPLAFKNALGGNGTTGWDWVIEAFRLARLYFPASTKLLINEYGTENDANARNQYITIINLLKSRGYIDGIGIQAHYFNLDNMTASQMTTCLNAYQATGIDVYISELDITGGGSDAGQMAKYQELFPVMWNHPSVKGITLWGYIVGQTWANGTGLVTSSGSERPAMTWLKSFMAGTGNPTLTVSPTSLSPGSGAGSSTITVTSNTSWTVSDNQTWISTSTTSGSNNGSFSVTVTANTGTASRSGTVTVAGGNITRNITVTQAGTGGGGNRTITVRARGTTGSERIELRVNNVVITSWTLTTSMANYTATAGTGTIRVQFTNDATTPARDVQVDYVNTGTTTFQSENQSVNTGAYLNGRCGGGGNSEWLHCNGYIEYAGSSSSNRSIVEEPLITQEIPVKAGSVFPNPSRRSFDVSLAGLSGATNLEITDLNGRVLKKISVSDQQKVSVTLDVKPGVYILRGVNAGMKFTRKISIL